MINPPRTAGCKDHTTRGYRKGRVSEKGSQQVAAGHRSMVIADAKPNIPESCQADQLMAWAKGSEAVPTIADSGLDKLIEELPLPLSYPGQPINLDSLNYDEWVESKEDWFKDQYPWIFELQEAPTTNNQQLITDSLATSHQPLKQFQSTWNC